MTLPPSYFQSKANKKQKTLSSFYSEVVMMMLGNKFNFPDNTPQILVVTQGKQPHFKVGASYLISSKPHHHLEQQKVKSGVLGVIRMELAPAFTSYSFTLAESFKFLFLCLLICKTSQVTADKPSCFPLLFYLCQIPQIDHYFLVITFL